MDSKPIIYQLIPRLFTNYIADCVPGGSISRNGAGKLNSITKEVLHSIKELGITHIWYTGVLEHAQCSDYSEYGIAKDNPHIVKDLPVHLMPSKIIMILIRILLKVFRTE